MTISIGRSSDIWNETKCDELTALWVQIPKLSTQQIGDRLGVTKNAVIGKARRLMLPPHKPLVPKQQQQNQNTPGRVQRIRAARKRVKPARRPLPPVNTEELPPLLYSMETEVTDAGVPLMELHSDRCHAVIGRGFDLMARYCADPVCQRPDGYTIDGGIKYENTPYCLGHARLFYHGSSHFI